MFSVSLETKDNVLSHSCERYSTQWLIRNNVMYIRLIFIVWLIKEICESSLRKLKLCSRLLFFTKWENYDRILWVQWNNSAWLLFFYFIRWFSQFSINRQWSTVRQSCCVYQRLSDQKFFSNKHCVDYCSSWSEKSDWSVWVNYLNVASYIFTWCSAFVDDRWCWYLIIRSIK